MTLNFSPIILPGVLIVLVLFTAGCTQVPAPVQTPSRTGAETVIEVVSPAVTAAAPENTTKEEMVAFVQEAVAYANRNGKDKALAEFSNRSGSFFRGVLYIYAYDYNGTTLAHPLNPEKIGVNRLFEKDAEGNLFVRDIRQAAYNGTGFDIFTYINPVHNNTVEKKLGYAMKVDDSWWLGSGIYIGPATIAANVTTMQPAP